MKHHQILHVKIENVSFDLNCHLEDAKLKSHLKLSNKILGTTFSDLQTKWKEIIKKRMLTVEDKHEEEFYKCKYCDFGTKYSNTFNRHELLHLNLNTTSSRQLVEVSPSIPKITTTIKNKMSNHQKHYTKLSCDNRDYVIQDELDLKSHINIQKCKNSEVLKSTVIKNNFQTQWKASIKKQMLLHEDKKQVKLYKCEYCAFKTIYTNTLKKHELLHMKIKSNRHKSNDDSSDVTSYQCKDCEFKSDNALIMHQHRIIHVSELKFACDLCSYKGKSQKYLNLHKKIHITEWKFSCDLCSFTGKSERDVRLHRRSHMIETIEFESN